jgi:hypothetical protein
VTLRRITVGLLGCIGLGLLCLIGYLAMLEAMTLQEAAGWALAGFLSLREIISKMENVALNIRADGDDE